MAANTLLNDLNEQQQEAVKHPLTPLLIYAGAGSGKTTVLTRRIAHMIQHYSVDPSGVLAITFTNKAAREMKTRLQSLLGTDVASRMQVSTFHSACLRILRAHAPLVGLKPGFVIYDQDDSKRLVRDVTEDVGQDPKVVKPAFTLSSISRSKNRLVSPEEYASSAIGVEQTIIGRIFQAYQQQLLENNAADFDDILVLTVDILRNHPEVLRSLQDKYRHILVDEYQDTNIPQNEIIRMLGDSHHSVCVVGDTDQCLLPDQLVRTPDGECSINKIYPGDMVLSSTGSAEPVASRVLNVQLSSYSGSFFTVSLPNGSLLRGTPHHFVPVNLDLPLGKYVVFLVQTGGGYRLGQARVTNDTYASVRDTGASRLWLLGVQDSAELAKRLLDKLSDAYGLPIYDFSMFDREIPVMGGEDYCENSSKAEQLRRDRKLLDDYPHYDFLPGGYVRVEMFSDGSKCIEYRASFTSNRLDVLNRLDPAAHPVLSSGSSEYRRWEVTGEDYRSLLRQARSMASRLGLPVRKEMRMDDRNLVFMPLSHLYAGMSLLMMRGNLLREERIVALNTGTYSGPVYDIEVEGAHNYVAQGALVSNSIYRFRGAEVTNLMAFADMFPHTKTITLERNYRSTQHILDAANAVISNNEQRPEKNLWTDKAGGTQIQFHTSPHDSAETEWISREIRSLLSTGIRGGEIAVLCRLKVLGQNVERSLVASGIPSKMVGGVPFFERMEVRDIISYLRLISNPYDQIAYQRAINTPRRGIGTSSALKVRSYARDKGLSLLDAIRVSDDIEDLPVKARTGLRDLSDVVDAGVAQMEAGESPSVIIGSVIQNIGYVEEMHKIHGDEANFRVRNLDTLIALGAASGSVSSFLENVSLSSEQDEEFDANRVIIMTIHAAKGLEFPVVFVPGMEEGIFPDKRSIHNPYEMEEERRLAYVAITRARDRLYLTRSKRRALWGSVQENEPSRFLDEIPEHLMRSNAQTEDDPWALD